MTYDAIVLGTGQGGVPLAQDMAQRGLKVAIVERGAVGGTCVNVGCTPTKTMIASARVAHVLSRAEQYGVPGSFRRGDKVDMEQVRRRKRDIVASFNGGSERRLEGTENLDLIRGHGRFVSPREIRVEGPDGSVVSLESERIVINTGTRPRIPNLPGAAASDFLTNESIMELDEVPSRLTIIGGGFIGAEFGQMFARFGSEVTIIHRRPSIFESEDKDIGAAMVEALEADGVRFLLGAEPVAMERAGAAWNIDLGTGEPVVADAVLAAAGRVPNTDELGIEAAGIEVDDRGWIRVDSMLRTNVDGIFAIGDVKGGPAFTHISYDDFRILRDFLFGEGEQGTSHRPVPFTVFTDPPLGRIGLSETQAMKLGKPFLKASMPMDYVARALEVDETRGLIKAIIDPETDRILGFSMFGIDGGEIAGAVQIAMMGNLPYTAIRDATFSHPTTLESLNNLFASVERIEP